MSRMLGVTSVLLMILGFLLTSWILGGSNSNPIKDIVHLLTGGVNQWMMAAWLCALMVLLCFLASPKPILESIFLFAVAGHYFLTYADASSSTNAITLMAGI